MSYVAQSCTSQHCHSESLTIMYNTFERNINSSTMHTDWNHLVEIGGIQASSHHVCLAVLCGNNSGTLIHQLQQGPGSAVLTKCHIIDSNKK